MPHKDRETRLAYLRSWKLKHRPSPKVEPQRDLSLPSRGIMTFSEDGARVQCHSCGDWFGALNTHLRMHGLDAHSYKDLFGLPRTASLLPPVTVDRYRAASLERDQGMIGRVYLPSPTPRPKGQSPRLGVRIEASDVRRGVYMRGGGKTIPKV